MDTQQQATDDVVPQPLSGQQVLFNMEGLIKNHITAIDKLKDEARKKKEMLDDILANDPTYQEHLKAAKEATQTKNATKSQLMKQPQAAELDKSIKDIKLELKENTGSLSDYCAEYSRLSGLTEIEDEEGNMLSMQMSVKLVRK